MRTARQAIMLTGLVLAMATSCKHADDGSRPSEPRGDGPSTSGEADEPPEPVRPPGRVVITRQEGEPVTVHVEVVREPREIREGLMYREHLPPDQGMLFLMDEEAEHTFWMKNTLISLDMIFIGADKTIAGIIENTTPLDETTRSVDAPSLYVLEVNAGWSQRHGVGPGDKVRFENVEE